MDWLRRSGVLDESYVKKAKKQPIPLPPRIEQFVPPPPVFASSLSSVPDDAQSLRSPTGAPGAMVSPGFGSGYDGPLSLPSSPGPRSPHDADAIAVMNTLNNASFAVIASPITQGPRGFPGGGRANGNGGGVMEHRTGSTSAVSTTTAIHNGPRVVHVPRPQQKWEWPTTGGTLNLSDRSTEERERLRAQQRKSYSAQLKLRDPPVAVRFPEMGDDDLRSGGGGGRSRDEITERCAGASSSAAHTTDDGSRSSERVKGDRAKSASKASAVKHGDKTHQRKGNGTVTPAWRASPTGARQKVPEALIRLCTTGLTMLDFVEGVIEVRVLQYQKLLPDPVEGVPVDPYTVGPNEPERGTAVYYHPKPFTYQELIEHPKLLSAERRRTMREAVMRTRTLSSDRYGQPVPYDKPPAATATAASNAIARERREPIVGRGALTSNSGSGANPTAGATITAAARKSVTASRAASSNGSPTESRELDTPLRPEDVKWDVEPTPGVGRSSSKDGCGSKSGRRRAGRPNSCQDGPKKTAPVPSSSAPTAPPSHMASTVTTPKHPSRRS